MLLVGLEMGVTSPVLASSESSSRLIEVLLVDLVMGVTSSVLASSESIRMIEVLAGSESTVAALRAEAPTVLVPMAAAPMTLEQAMVVMLKLQVSTRALMVISFLDFFDLDCIIVRSQGLFHFYWDRVKVFDRIGLGANATC